MRARETVRRDETVSCEKSGKQRVKYNNVPSLLFKGGGNPHLQSLQAELPKSFNMHAEPCDEEL